MDESDADDNLAFNNIIDNENNDCRVKREEKEKIEEDDLIAIDMKENLQKWTNIDPYKVFEIKNHKISCAELKVFIKLILLKNKHTVFGTNPATANRTLGQDMTRAKAVLQNTIRRRIYDKYKYFYY